MHQIPKSISTNFSEENKPTTIMHATSIHNEKMLTVSKRICNEMKEHFAKIGEKLDVQMTDTNYKTYLKILGKRPLFPVCLGPTDNQEIIVIIACLHICKSENIDIPTLIKKSKYLIAPFLANSFNECIKSGKYTDILNIAKRFLFIKVDLTQI